MVDKEILINDLKIESADLYAKYYENDQDPFYGGACSSIQEAIKIVEQQKEQFEWINPEMIPIGYRYILLSFSNHSYPCIGRYEEDKDGNGAYYIGDEKESCSSKGMMVNAWMPLPEAYKEDIN